MNKEKSYSFNKRYFVIGVLVYILSVYIAMEAKAVLPDITYWHTCFTAAGVLLLYVLIRIFIRKKRKAVALCTAAFVGVLIFIFGFSYCLIFVRDINELNEQITKAEKLDGIVVGKPTLSNSGKSYRVVLDVHNMYVDGQVLPVEKMCKAQFYISAEDNGYIPGAGDNVSFKNGRPNTKRPAYKGGFDYREYLKQEKIVYSTYIEGVEKISGLKEKRPVINSLRNLGIKLRDAVLVSTESEAYDRDERELLKGILVGETLGFSDELYDKYSSSGFIHIASVSGMHTSYLLLAISFLLGLIRLPKRGVCLAAIPILILFSAVALFEPSVCRAVIMMIVMLLASIIKRNNDSITALSVAALVLSIENPYCLYNYSFLLSFGATLGVLIFYQPFKNTLNFTVVSMAEGGKRSFARRMIYKLNVFSVDSICLSLGAAIGLGYFMIRFFGRFQWGSIIGNIFIFPLTAISFIGGYVNCFIYAIHKPLSQLMAKLIINPSLFLTNKLADIFSADLFSIRIPYFSETFFVLYIFGCTLIYYILTAEKEKKS